MAPRFSVSSQGCQYKQPKLCISRQSEGPDIGQFNIHLGDINVNFSGIPMIV